MDFARQQRDPTRHLIGITFVVLFHALILWAMVSGLARKAVEVIKKPIEYDQLNLAVKQLGHKGAGAEAVAA